ncbi:uncharacterized protein HMPREF1541_10167 [Cyphellophora europaea CBS 101466]|uniref:N-acetyltransferase domain-containing protein n=1 Tax=Cyphellophora europaea (strain CBS 101466) TaxID=1220924 RepID=W2S743_CYPE1|nr:uncharacterized protein HMPREF1541_10167 [Cyphellophora europaea CBS 101466]ETN44497.1 hypothetical protein HMPREF1541_10167 [Cyphellophora europaea CBS 101466]
MAANQVRSGTLADIPQMADVFAAGFIDDDVFGRFMHPKRREYPHDWLRHWNKDLRNHLLSPAVQCYVRVSPDGIVKGCVMMARIGQGGDDKVASESLSHRLLRQIYVAQDYLESFVWSDRSADHEAMAIFDKNWDDIKHHFSGPRAECWLIELLCIHPDSQKAGFGREIIQTAIDLCKTENPPIPLCVIASDAGDAFYEKLGFREAGRADVGDLSGVKGGSLKFYEEHLKQ